MLFISSKGLLPCNTPPLLDVISLPCLTADDAPTVWDDMPLQTTDTLSQISSNAYVKINMHYNNRICAYMHMCMSVCVCMCVRMCVCMCLCVHLCLISAHLVFHRDYTVRLVG